MYPLGLAFDLYLEISCYAVVHVGLWQNNEWCFIDRMEERWEGLGYRVCRPMYIHSYSIQWSRNGPKE